MEDKDNTTHLMEKGQTGRPTDRHSRTDKTVKGQCLLCLRQNSLMVLTLIGITIGFVLGFVVREFKPSDDVIMWIGMPGDLYMRILKMCVVPLTACTVISGWTPKTNGKIGLTVVLLVALTHVIAVITSLVLFFAISPGAKTSEVSSKQLGIPVESHDIFADLLRNLFPDNMVVATFQQTVTKYELDDATDDGDNENNAVVAADANYSSPNNTFLSLANVSLTQPTARQEGNYKRVVSSSDGVNVLGLITICCVFGIAAGKFGERVSTFLNFFNEAMEIMFLVINWFMWLTPIGVVSLVAQSLSKVDDVGKTFSDLGLFVVTVTSAVLFHWLVNLPALYFVIVRKSPLRYLLSVCRPASIGFAATNSAIAFPEIIHACEEKLDVDSRVSRLSVPLCLTLNADGSSAFIAGASLFIVRYTGFDISADRIFIIAIFTVVSCMAIPSIPSASIMTVIIILSAINVPINNVALLFAVEWFLDRIRTAANVVSHIGIAAMTGKLCQNTLRRLDMTSFPSNGMP